MEIIERGEPPDERKYTGRCFTCKTKVKFRQSEATAHYDQRDGNYLEVKCPVCGKPITVAM